MAPAIGFGWRAARVGVALATLILFFVVVRWWDFTIPHIGGTRYQAVFLENGQTWFGRYRERLGPYVVLESVYYVQSKGSPDPDGPPINQLIRRGNELHGPDAQVLIPKTAILFVEDLRDDSPIARYMADAR